MVVPPENEDLETWRGSRKQCSNVYALHTFTPQSMWTRVELTLDMISQTSKD